MKNENIKILRPRQIYNQTNKSRHKEIKLDKTRQRQIDLGSLKQDTIFSKARLAFRTKIGFG